MKMKNILYLGLFSALISSSISIQAAEQRYAPFTREMLEQADKERQESQQIGQYQNNPVQNPNNSHIARIPQKEEAIYNNTPPRLERIPAAIMRHSQSGIQSEKSKEAARRSLRDIPRPSLLIENNTPHKIKIRLKDKTGNKIISEKIASKDQQIEINIDVNDIPLRMTVMHSGLNKSNPLKERNPELAKVLVEQENMSLELKYDQEGEFVITQ